MQRRNDPPLKGDLVEVQWFDIMEDSTGEADRAALAHRVSIGYFWEEKLDHGIPCVVTTSTTEKGDVVNSGYCIYPKANITKLSVIRRKRRKKMKDGSGIN